MGTGGAASGPSAPKGGGGRLEALIAAAREGAGRGPAPVDKWNPPDCGDMDMRIAADGTWHYMGSPIGRPAMVRLFASVLAKEGERFVLKTPVEKIGITVDDAPFLAVEMAEEASEAGPVLVVRTNLDDLVRIGPGHDLRFAEGERAGEFVPYVHVRHGLEARFTRALAYELAEKGEVRDGESEPMFGVASQGVFYPMMPASALDIAGS